MFSKSEGNFFDVFEKLNSKISINFNTIYITNEDYLTNFKADMIVKNNTSIDEIRSISSSSESSRNYRVLGELVKAQSEVAKDLIDLHLQKKELEKEEKTENYNQTNNIVFAGSTNELMKMISKESEKVIDEPKD